MIEMIQSNWLAFLLVVIVAALIALWLIARPKKTKDRSYRPDVLDEGVGPAKRNQAFIDAPPASAGSTNLHEHEPPASPEALGGVGIAVSAGALFNEEEHEAHEREKADHMPASAEDAQAVAAAVKIHNDDMGGSDDLRRIKGLGPKLVDLLGSMGISRYDQIAAWTDEDVLKIDEQLGRFKGRITRDDWRSQAKYLADGDTAGYEAKFGKL